MSTRRRQICLDLRRNSLDTRMGGLYLRPTEQGEPQVDRGGPQAQMDRRPAPRYLRLMALDLRFPAGAGLRQRPGSVGGGLALQREPRRLNAKIKLASLAI